MAEKLVLSIPQKMQIKNTSDKEMMFRPYRENFNVSVPSGLTFGFTCTTVGQCLYYLKQGYTLSDNKGLEVELVNGEFTTGDELVSPALVTLRNTTPAEGGRMIKFIPYRERFEYSVKPQNSITLETKTLGQLLYYMAQATDGLEVTFAEDK